MAASRILSEGRNRNLKVTKPSIRDLERCLYATKVLSYAQGYALLKAAAKTYGWDLNYGDIALMWRGRMYL